MGKLTTLSPIEGRPIESCLDEDGDLLERSNPRAEMYKLPSSDRVGVTFYPCVRSLRAYSSDRTLCCDFSSEHE
jgi:hypothetical protein